MARAKVDFPAPLGPTIATLSPASIPSWIPLTIGFLDPGAPTTTASRKRLPTGSGKAIFSSGLGIWLNSLLSRSYCWRALIKPFQLPIIKSMGASALPNKIEPAIIRPGDISWLIARYAPAPKTKDCNNILNVLEKFIKNPAR